MEIPKRAKTYHGQCALCTRILEVADVTAKIPGCEPRPGLPMCRECLSAIMVSTRANGTKYYVDMLDGTTALVEDDGKITKPFTEIETGRKLPEGVKTIEGSCKQCPRTGKLAFAKVEISDDLYTPTMQICSECLADFIAGARVQKRKVYVEMPDGTAGLVKDREVKK